MRILYDSKSAIHKEPFGTILPGQDCRVSVHIPASCITREAYLILNRENGEEYASFPMEKTGGSGDYEYYSLTFSLPEPGLFFYFFRIVTANEAFSLFRYGFDQTNMEEGDLWQLSCVPEGFGPPEDFLGRVMYQIFPDRFNKEGLCNTEGKLLPYWLHENTRDIPHYQPDENGVVQNCDFFGGNLAGIAAKLDYLKGLGVSVIYLNPIFKAWSNHRYDTADYMKIDELLGTEEDFSRLCRLARERDIKIILDGVFSHTGSNSRYFDAEHVFGGGACSDPDSPYRSWYDFEEYPDKYTSWWGIKTLPCVNELDESYLDFIINGEDSVVVHWLMAGADGFRLDVADELPDEFISRLRSRLKEIKPDSLLIGEVWEDASSKISYGVRRKYFTGGELDSVMNYPFRTAIINYVRGEDGGRNLRDTVMDIAENYPPAVLRTLMNILSTHDTPRLLTALSPSPMPETKEERAGFHMSPEDRETALRRFYCAVFLQFILPGMPCIYYGDELGCEGWEDPFCRGFFDWDALENNPIPDFYRALSALKNNEPALKSGAVFIESDGLGRVFITREHEKSRLKAAVNMGEPLFIESAGEMLFSEKCESRDGGVFLSNGGFFLERL